MSGLKINFHKSIVCGIGVEEGLVKEFAKKSQLPRSEITSYISWLTFKGKSKEKKYMVTSGGEV